jgi:predicted RecB family endonuclease
MTANTPASRKAKGREFQQEIRNAIIKELNLDENDLKSTSMGASGIDIFLAASARDMFPYAIECKRTEKLNINAALAQCEINAKKEGLRPLLVFRRNRGKAWAVVEWDEFLRLASPFSH